MDAAKEDALLQGRQARLPRQHGEEDTAARVREDHCDKLQLERRRLRAATQLDPIGTVPLLPLHARASFRWTSWTPAVPMRCPLEGGSTTGVGAWTVASASQMGVAPRCQPTHRTTMKTLKPRL